MDDPSYFSPAVQASCYLCYGTGRVFEERCVRCPPPVPERVRAALRLLTVPQMKFLRFGVHSLAMQPVTEMEWKTICMVAFYADERDEEHDPDTYEELTPSKKYWFAGGQSSSGGGRKDRYSFWYNSLGLALREALICGADVRVND